MFERSTDRARRVLVLAHEEARLLDHRFVGTAAGGETSGGETSGGEPAGES
ncbi:MAG TPA: hypothetical protein VMS00_09690 [Acidimicrobiales bacterium]|nr:hypothetical protein [Acidimicrobiales bacterium]